MFKNVGYGLLKEKLESVGRTGAGWILESKKGDKCVEKLKSIVSSDTQRNGITIRLQFTAAVIGYC